MNRQETAEAIQLFFAGSGIMPESVTIGEETDRTPTIDFYVPLHGSLRQSFWMHLLTFCHDNDLSFHWLNRNPRNILKVWYNQDVMVLEMRKKHGIKIGCLSSESEIYRTIHRP